MEGPGCCPALRFLMVVGFFFFHACLPQNTRLRFATGNPFALRQRMKAAAFCLSVAGCVSPPVRQALSDDALQRAFGARLIINTQLGAVVLAEIELGQITVKMLFADVLVGANHPTLEDREEAFQRIGVDLVARLAFANILLGMIDAFMGCDRASELVELRAVGCAGCYRDRRWR